MSVFVGDIGTILQVNAGEDISTATVKEFFIEKPDKSVLTKTAVFVTDGIDGLLKYTFLAGEIDSGGAWRVQVHLVFGTNDFATGIGTFSVGTRLA